MAEKTNFTAKPKNAPDRRKFLKTAGLAGGSLATAIPKVHAASDYRPDHMEAAVKAGKEIGYEDLAAGDQDM